MHVLKWIKKMPTVRKGPSGGLYIIRKGKKVYLSSMTSTQRKRAMTRTRKPKKPKRRTNTRVPFRGK